MRVFIAGGSGFIGSSVVRKFLKENAEVHILIRKTSNLWRLEDIKEQVNLHYGELSLQSDVEAVIKSIKPDVVINCSGIFRDVILDDQHDLIRSNLVNTINLVNVSLRSGVETLFNTGSAKECSFSNKPILVNRCNGSPIGLYGVVKRAERYYIDMISRNFGKSYVNFRLFTPFGFFDAPFRLIPHIILSLLHNEDPEIGNPAGGRSFIFLEDIATTYYAAAKNPEKLSRLTEVNLGSPKLTTVADVASLLYRMFGRHYDYEVKEQYTPKEYLYPEEKEVMKLLSKLKVNLTPFQEGLSRTVKWFRDNENFYRDDNIVGKMG